MYWQDHQPYMSATETVTTLLSAGTVLERENGEINQEHAVNNSNSNNTHCAEKQEYTVCMVYDPVPCPHVHQTFVNIVLFSIMACLKFVSVSQCHGYRSIGNRSLLSSEDGL